MPELQPESRAHTCLAQISDIIVNKYEVGYKYKAKELRLILDSIVAIVDDYGASTTGDGPARLPQPYENRTAHADPIVSAEIHSDDHTRKVGFQANRWFSQASDDEIRELAAIDWENDLEADRIAYFMEALDLEVEKVLDYCRETKHTLKESIGFEVSVNRDQAMSWLAVHRSRLWKELVRV